MLKLEQAVIVEGRYDKIRLSNIIDAVIITTEGFRIFKDAEKRAFIRRLAETAGIIILTDSDAAGFRIRSYIKNAAPDGKVYNAYIPDIYGKERRKTRSSAEGKLGVEGVPDGVIIDAILRALPEPDTARGEPRRGAGQVTAADLYAAGLTGTPEARARREEYLRSKGLPGRMSVGALLKYLNQTGETL